MGKGGYNGGSTLIHAGKADWFAQPKKPAPNELTPRQKARRIEEVSAMIRKLKPLGAPFGQQLAQAEAELLRLLGLKSGKKKRMGNSARPQATKPDQSARAAMKAPRQAKLIGERAGNPATGPKPGIGEHEAAKVRLAKILEVGRTSNTERYFRRLVAGAEADVERTRPQPTATSPEPALSPADEQKIAELKRDIMAFAVQAKRAAEQHEETRQKLIKLLGKYDNAPMTYPETRKLTL